MTEQNPSRVIRAAVPGLTVTIGLAAGAWLLVWVLAQMPPPVGQWPLSMMPLAIVTGLALSGVAAHRPGWAAGLNLAHGPILKIAVALIGLQLSLFEASRLGLAALPLVVVVILIGLLLTLGLARFLGANTRLAVLLAVGTSICGASAIAAAAPGLRARSTEVGYAMACIALLGLAATLLYPPLLVGFLDDPEDVGLVLGVAIHDTAQVTAAATLHEQVSGSEGTLVSATVAKLIRNTAMLVVIPLVVWLVSRREGGNRAMVTLPLFIVAFIALSGVRSFGDAWLGPNHSIWQASVNIAGQLSLFAFTMAVTAMAMGINLGEIKEIGWKPAFAAMIAATAMLTFAVLWVT